MSQEELKSLSFYSWQCITLKLSRRNIDLVVKDEKQMQILLKFLVHSLKTVDGVKDTAVGLLKVLNSQSFEDMKA